MSTDRVLVVGGGIGGLAAAAALARLDVEVTVAEVVSEFDTHGIGLGQPANGLRALKSLGVLDEALDAGYVFDRLNLFDQRGDLIAAHRFRLGGPDVPPFGALLRADLHRLLHGAAVQAGATIRMASTVDAIDETPDGVQVTLTDGTELTVDAVVGFDGIRSAVRSRLFGDDHAPRYSGFAAWRAIVPRPDEVTSMAFYQGLGSKTGVMPLSDEVMYLFHIRSEPGNPWHEASTMVPKLVERLAGYEGVVGDVRDGLRDGDEIVYSAIEPVLVPLPWHRGRVVLGGDAVHASPPHLTQGAAMAMEDALVLAEELTSRTTSLDEALDAYGRRRFGRCRYVQEFSIDMLHREQAIHTQEDLDAARPSIAETMSRRLGESDDVMNVPVFGEGAVIDPPAPRVDVAPARPL